MSHSKPLFTMFTGTYNRASYLPTVYACLEAQTMRDFEWVVVDDGSTDATRDQVQAMIGGASFPIRYIYKKNGGVHTAHNVAVRAAVGEFFLRCDNDDEFVPEAVKTLSAAWYAIPERRRDEYSGVSCLCMNQSGAVIGDRYPESPWDSNPRVLAGLRGEKWGFHRTAILREFLFPEFDGEKHIPESVVWARIGEHFRTRCINVPLRVFHDTPQSVSKKVPKLRYSCGNGFALCYREELTRPQPRWQSTKLAANYTRTCLGLHKGIRSIVGSSPRKLLTLATLPLGAALYARDRVRGFTRPAS